jgi:ribosomal protein L11 methyltransferase
MKSTFRRIRLTFRLPPSHQDLLIGLLTPMGFTGFLQEEKRMAAFLPVSRWRTPLKARVRTTLNRFAREFPSLDLSFRASEVQEKNWNARWERSAGIVEATGTILIKPSWRKLRARDRGKLVLHIDPQMSFGTGHHETTRLCLTLLEERLVPGSRVLDVGCGSGILAIAAAKLGARSVVALDTDEWAWRNARENARKNRVKNIRVLRGTLDAVQLQQYGMVLSNIDLPTNLRLLPGIIRRLSKDGVAIISGLLSTDCERLLKALKGRRIVPLECVEENGWVAMALGRAHAH